MAIGVQYAKFDNKVYNVAQILDKALFARVAVNARTLPSKTASLYKRFNAGDNVGTVYSYIIRDGLLWWAFEYKVNVYQTKAYYILHNKDVFSLNALKQQGAKNVEKQIEEKKKDEEILTGSGSLFDFGNIQKYLKWVLIAAIVGLALYYSIQSGLLKKFVKK